MDLFDSNRDFLGALLKQPDQALERERKAPTFSSQKSLVFKFANRLIQNRKTPEKTVQLTHYDERLADHLNKNGGWNHSSQLMWTKRGFELNPAKERIKTLQKAGFLCKSFAPTPKFNTDLQLLHQKLKNRTAQRFGYFREIRKQKAQDFFQKMSPGQQEFITNLGTFRQMTPAQARFFGTSRNELRSLHERGIVEVHHVLCDQRPIQLYSLTKKNDRNLSGKDLARDGAGIEKPPSGIQQDHSKILHDVSVLDAVRNAKAHFLKKGYTHLASLSEHQMYQTKTSANSDTNQHYADAYLTVMSPSGDEESVAVEFGNYPPSYMKEKMQGIDADHRVIYTHDANRAEEYRNVLADISGPPVEVFVIPTPHMEIER